VLGKDESSAFSGSGYLMLSSDQPLELHARGQVWASNTSSGVVQVSVILENYTAK
jgi:hypothetical protein